MDSQIKNVLKLCLDKPVAYHSAFGKIAGSAATGLFLSQAYYWTLHLAESNVDGWFYKTREGWMRETGLSRREQELARRSLVTLGILETERRGVPAKMYFRLDLDRLYELLFLLANGGQSTEQPDKVVERVADIYRVQLKTLSQTAYNRAVNLGVESELVSYEEIYRRDKGTCYLCGKVILRGPGQSSGSLQFDHVVPIAERGPHIASNIKSTHSQCNLKKGKSQSVVVRPTDKPLIGQLVS